MAVAVGNAGVVLQGWSQFLNELEHFLLSSSRNFHSANEDYTNYVMEKTGSL